MKKKLLLLCTIVTTGFAIHLVSCNESKNEKEEATPETATVSKEDMIKRGDYLVTTVVCNDCHSPKVFTPQGEPLPDSTKLLSGHQAGSQLPPMETKLLKPGHWISMSPDLTAFVGPWGLSYAANLTPDSATGIGAWNETTFINTLRSGKHLGNGRAILPPMPWPFIGKMTDNDLKAIFAYLQS